MADFAELKAELEKLDNVVPAVVTLLHGVAAQIEAAVAANDAGDNAMLATLAADVKAQADALATAVSVGTPGAPPTPPA